MKITMGRPQASASFEAIGFVRASRKELSDDGWDQVQTVIELDPKRFDSSALQGLEEYSHVEILFHMNQVDPGKAEMGARHPRGNTNWPRVGIFAQRGKDRPNPIGATICGIRRIEGTQLHLTGLDAVDGTPVLDIKPWCRELGPRGDVRQPSWMTELMKNYWS
jgi:tRNA-Thr(GGU) m(6)t(6)A37 methyltransferase TsaA